MIEAFDRFRAASKPERRPAPPADPAAMARDLVACGSRLSFVAAVMGVDVDQVRAWIGEARS